MFGQDLFADMERRFEELRRNLLESPALEGAAPTMGIRPAVCDLVEDEREYSLTFELPGVKKDDIRLDVEDDRVRVRAKTERQEEKEQRGYIRRERASETFERTVTLPDEVDADGARATFRNGILSVTLPKREPSKRRARSIDID